MSQKFNVKEQEIPEEIDELIDLCDEENKR